MLKVHQVIDGPYEFLDHWSLVCLVEYEGEVYEDELPFETFNEAYAFMTKTERSEYPTPFSLDRMYFLN